MITGKLRQLALGIALSASAISGFASPQTFDQWATFVVGFSSENGATGDAWKAIQALGPADIPLGDASTPRAWQSTGATGERDSLKWISLGFAQTVNATGAILFENSAFPYVYRIDALLVEGSVANQYSVLNSAPVWTGNQQTSPSPQGGYHYQGDVWGAVFQWNQPQPSFAFNALKIYVDGTWHTNLPNEQLDAVMLRAPVPEPETYAMLLAGLGLLGFMARRRKQ